MTNSPKNNPGSNAGRIGHRRDAMKFLATALVACAGASALGFLTLCLLPFLEIKVYSLPDDEMPAPYPVIFNLPSADVQFWFLLVAAGLGAFLAANIFAAASPLWRFHLPFFLGLLFLASALGLALANLQAFVGDLGWALVWPGAMQVAFLTFFGLVILVTTCLRDR